MSGKIIVRTAEGLGNQLFMYANGYAISKKIGYKLLLDDESGYFKKKNIRNYQLNNFNINAEICDDDLKFNSNLKDFKRKVMIKLDRFKKKKNFLIEKKDKFKKTKFSTHDLQSFSKLLYVEGHFESENYFFSYKKDLKLQFTLKNEDSFQNNKYLDLIKNNKNVISICVRQNRFSERIGNQYDQNSIMKSNEFTKKTINYINRAVDYIDNKYKDALFLVWSNDFNNLRNYFNSEKFIFVDNEINKPLTDFYLLLNCKNFIVGPTSFHWWPAWLNYDKTSLIFRPKDIDISNNIDFWPNDWLSI